MTLEEIRQEVQNASLVLVGLGEELTGDMAAFYQELKGLLEHKACTGADHCAACGSRGT